MKFVAPDSWSISIRRHGKMAELSYVETYKNKKIVKRTVDIMKLAFPMHGLKLEIVGGGKSVLVSGKCKLQTVANMMTSEFMTFGSIGRMRLGELLANVAMSSLVSGAASATASTTNLIPSTTNLIHKKNDPRLSG